MLDRRNPRDYKTTTRIAANVFKLCNPYIFKENNVKYGRKVGRVLSLQKQMAEWKSDVVKSDYSRYYVITSMLVFPITCRR